LSEDTLKVVIPMAGLGTRLRPHTWSKPKQLVSVAGKAVLGHVLDMLATVPDRQNIELVNIVGYLGEQIEAYMQEHYPQLPAHYVMQENPKGQSHALYLAREFLHGPMLMIFADTLVETNLSFLDKESAGAVAWVKEVPDPRRFGVAEVGHDGWVQRLIEKPTEMDNNLAVVGFYYFAHAEDVIAAIEEQMRRDVQIKGEYFLADAVNIMLEQGLKMRIQRVDIWLDAGTPESLLETNNYLLCHGQENNYSAQHKNNSVIIPPVFIHPTAQVHESVIGPYASIGAGCIVRNSIIRNSILEDEAEVSGAILETSLIGRKAIIQRRSGKINVGDSTELVM
jgi:glucose-1-phosphate thymidylyltransferase